MIQQAKEPASRLYVLILFVIGMLAFMAIAARTEIQQHDQDAAFARQASSQRRIVINTAKLVTIVNEQCRARNAATAGTNEVLDSLISAVRITKSLPPAEKVTRIARYEKVKVDMLPCPK